MAFVKRCFPYVARDSLPRRRGRCESSNEPQSGQEINIALTVLRSYSKGRNVWRRSCHAEWIYGYRPAWGSTRRLDIIRTTTYSILESSFQARQELLGSTAADG